MVMSVEVVGVTPEMATQWIEKNSSRQRKARITIIDRYARDMINGEWTLTHQGIAFDCKGNLIDGQHRLLAVIKAGVTVRMMVVRDAPASAFDHVDLGYGRSTTDVLNAGGAGWITHDRIATARFMEYGATPGATINRSPFEMRNMVEAHKNAMEFVFQNMERKVRGITIAPVLAAIGVAYYAEHDRVKLAEFIRLLVSGVAQDPVQDAIVIKLREWLRDVSGQASAGAREEAFLKTQRVIKAYMSGERLSKLYTPSEPVYPVIKRVSCVS